MLDPAVLRDWWEQALAKDYLRPTIATGLAKGTITIPYPLLHRAEIRLAETLLEQPRAVLDAAQQALPPGAPPLRVVDLGEANRVPIRTLRPHHLGRLVSIEGLVKRASTIRPGVILAAWRCRFCHCLVMIEAHGAAELEPPLECSETEGGCGKRSAAFDLDEDRCIKVATQHLELQESPETLVGGEQPGRLPTLATHDLCDQANPGDRVVVNGILRDVRKRKPGGRVDAVSEYVLHACSIERRSQGYEDVTLTKEDEEAIHRLAQDPHVYDLLRNSIAPSLYGLDDEKLAIALQLFGGVERHHPDGLRVRGDIHLLLLGDPGIAKCLGRGTEVLLWDGSVLPAEAIRPGHLLMGPDSKPRLVRSTTSGRGPLYRINPVKGKPWVCNDAHIMTLTGSKRQQGKVIDVPLTEHLARYSDRPDSEWKLFRVGVSFPHRPVPFDPYLIGVWLGDGTLGEAHVSCSRPEVVQYLRMAAQQLGLELVLGTGNSPTHRFRHHTPEERKGQPRVSHNLRQYLRRACEAGGAKRIPREYLVNDEEVRLRLLAGIVDTDGHLNNGCYVIVIKDDELAKQVAYLARSLGFHVDHGTTVAENMAPGVVYNRLTISGDLTRVPVLTPNRKAQPRKQVKRVNVTGWAAEPIGDGEYFGFTLDGDGRFLLGDFTVTHNTMLLRSAARLSPRGIFTSGRGSSAAGLTATVQRDPDTDRWTFEAGAMVLADRGLCAVDEIDKMRDEDRDAILPALEQGVVTLNKAGLSVELNARCSVLGAGNPRDGRFDREYAALSEQIELSPPLLSRFDLIFLMLDVPDEARDRAVIRHINQPTAPLPPISVGLLRKYVAYARRHCNPVESEGASGRIEDFYVQLRRSGVGDGRPRTPRQGEAVKRLAQAAARVRLSSVVEERDVDLAIGLVRECLERLGGDEDKVVAGTSARKRDAIHTVLGLVGGGAVEDEVVRAAWEVHELPERRVREILDKLLTDGRLTWVGGRLVRKEAST